MSFSSSSLGDSPFTLSNALNLSSSPLGKLFVADNAPCNSLLNISLYLPNLDKTFGTGVSQSNIAMCSEVDITCIGIEFKWSSGRGFEEWPGSAAGLQLERALFGPYRGSHKFLNLRYEPDKRDE